MSPVLQGFLSGGGAVLILLGLYLFVSCVRIMRSRDPYAPTELVWVSLPFGVLALGLGGVFLWAGIA